MDRIVRRVLVAAVALVGSGDPETEGSGGMLAGGPWVGLPTGASFVVADGRAPHVRIDTVRGVVLDLSSGARRIPGAAAGGNPVAGGVAWDCETDRSRLDVLRDATERLAAVARPEPGTPLSAVCGEVTAYLEARRRAEEHRQGWGLRGWVDGDGRFRGALERFDPGARPWLGWDAEACTFAPRRTWGQRGRTTQLRGWAAVEDDTARVWFHGTDGLALGWLTAPVCAVEARPTVTVDSPLSR
jgi:hypothetical protein